MFYTIYNILSVFLLVPVLLYHLFRSVSRHRPAAFRERFGHIPPEDLRWVRNHQIIWLHAVSVGEAIAARPLLKALREEYLDHAIVISTTTETGRAIAATFPEKDLCIYFPFDFLPAVRRALDAINPALIIIMETEIWPNFTREARLRNIPVILANGRISDRSFKRYLKFNWFFRHPLQLFKSLCMQTATDRERIVAIGAPLERTQITGNLKFDIPFRKVSEVERGKLRERYAISVGTTIITAGSTHSGEEESILNAYRELLTTSDKPFLILAPRHPERAEEVATLLKKSGFLFRRRSMLEDASSRMFRSGNVLLVDTIGELMSFYAMSDLVFVGGSLVPTGGHNLLEPASLGVPCIFGPHMTNFREITDLVLRYQAGIPINTPAELTDAFRSLMDDATQRRIMGQNGLRMMQESGGATDRHMDVVAKYLAPPKPQSGALLG